VPVHVVAVAFEPHRDLVMVIADQIEIIHRIFSEHEPVDDLTLRFIFRPFGDIISLHLEVCAVFDPVKFLGIDYPVSVGVLKFGFVFMCSLHVLIAGKRLGSVVVETGDTPCLRRREPGGRFRHPGPRTVRFAVPVADGIVRRAEFDSVITDMRGSSEKCTRCHMFQYGIFYIDRDAVFQIRSVEIDSNFRYRPAHPGMQAVPVRGDGNGFVGFKILIVGSGSVFCVTLSEHPEHFQIILDSVVPVEPELSEELDRCYLPEVAFLVIAYIGDGIDIITSGPYFLFERDMFVRRAFGRCGREIHLSAIFVYAFSLGIEEENIQ